MSGGWRRICEILSLLNYKEEMKIFEQIPNTNVPIGGDFNRIFDHADYLAMLNIPDEATCILRGHLILEEVLNLWTSKTTGTEDLFSGTFVPFKTKLVISKNLGLADDFYRVLDKVNDIRNKFSHRKGYALEKSYIDSLANLVDAIPSDELMGNSKEFQLYVSGKDSLGNVCETVHKWNDCDVRRQFVIVFVLLMLKFTVWIQKEFVSKNIEFTIIKSS